MESLTFDAIDTASFGADDYESGEGDPVSYRALDEDRVIAHLDAEVRADHIRIRWIEVDEDRRGAGLARKLVENLTADYPELALTTGGFTDDGEAFFSQLAVPVIAERDPLLD